MVIKKITVSQTRQIQPFTPSNYSIEAEPEEGENPKIVIRQLHKLLLQELYKDAPEERDKLIARFCTKDTE